MYTSVSRSSQTGQNLISKFKIHILKGKREFKVSYYKSRSILNVFTSNGFFHQNILISFEFCKTDYSKFEHCLFCKMHIHVY